MNKREIGEGLIKSVKFVTKYASAVSLAVVVPVALGIGSMTLYKPYNDNVIAPKIAQNTIEKIDKEQITNTEQLTEEQIKTISHTLDRALKNCDIKFDGTIAEKYEMLVSLAEQDNPKAKAWLVYLEGIVGSMGIALSTLTMLASPFVTIKIKEDMEDILNM